MSGSGPSNFNRPSDSIIAAINAPAWVVEELTEAPVEAEQLEALIEVPLPTSLRIVESEPVPLLVENISNEVLNQRTAASLLLSKTAWGDTVIAFLDTIGMKKDDEGVISFGDINKIVESRCDSSGLSRGEGIFELRSLLEALRVSGTIRHYERYTEFPNGYRDGMEGYIIPTDPAHHGMFLLARACNQIDEFAPDAQNPTNLFVETATRIEWPVSLSDFISRISERGGESSRGSNLTSMCYAIWPSADEFNLLRLEALTRCAISSGVVEVQDSEIGGLKCLSLTEAGQALLAEVRH